MKKDVLPLEIAEVLSLEAAVRPFVTTIQAEEENLNKLQHIESIQVFFCVYNLYLFYF